MNQVSEKVQTADILDRIVAAKRLRLAKSMADLPLPAIQRKAATVGGTPPDFSCALRGAAKISVIAEIKRASPSCGGIMPELSPRALATAYRDAGVQAISVLTEEDYFCGSKADFAAVHSAVSLPLLRKDFIIDSWQIYESRLMGAAAILLICAILDDSRLIEYLKTCHGLGMAAVVEVHDLAQLMRALACGAKIIGINNRDLRTFSTDLKTTDHLAGLIPGDRLVIAASGIRNASDLARVYRAGAHAALIGESLVRACADGRDICRHFASLRQELPL